MKKTFDIVVAIDNQRGIGKGGQLPWQLPADMKHFKDLTVTAQSKDKQNAVIMGRKTWESLPIKFQPLPHRINVVLSHNKKLSLPYGVVRASSLEEGLRLLQQPPWETKTDKIFVIGGAQIFEKAICHPSCAAIHLTHILKKFPCDAFFPQYEKFTQKVSESPHYQDQGIKFYFAVYRLSPQ